MKEQHKRTSSRTTRINIQHILKRRGEEQEAMGGGGVCGEQEAREEGREGEGGLGLGS